MKKLGLIITLSLGMISTAALAAEYREDRAAYSSERHGDRLEYQINKMNRMLTHVQWELRRYGASWRLRRDVSAISRESDRINWRYRHNQFERFRMGREVESVRDRLHNIEVRLRVRGGDFFRWD